MAIRIFLFQWDPAAAAKRAGELREAGFEVELETEDGGRGCRRVLDQKPDLILLDLARRPSHSRESAAAIRSFKLGRRIPMLFIDGNETDIAKAKAGIIDPLFTTSELLMHHLGKFEP